MPRTIDYHFTLVSPWACLGHAAFMDVVKRHAVTVRYKPMALGTVFPASGGMPLAKRHPLRVAYREVELQRWREKRGLSFHLKPAFWPFDPIFIDCVTIALAARGDDVEAFVAGAFAGIFTEERDLTDPGVVADLLTTGGLDTPAIMKAAVDPATKAAYEANTRDALEAGVFGAPAYVLDGEVFWGQDRIDMLDDALRSGRAPFRSTKPGD